MAMVEEIALSHSTGREVKSLEKESTDQRKGTRTSLHKCVSKGVTTLQPFLLFIH